MSGVKPDTWIIEQAQKGMIEPFEAQQVRQHSTHPRAPRVISYGVSSYGYDARLAAGVKIFTNAFSTIVDPKNFDERCLVAWPEDDIEIVIPPNSFALGRTVEYIRVPRDVLVLCIGKSTYARVGINVNCTPLEPEWEGHITVEIANTTPLPARVYANEGLLQLIFIGAETPCAVSYADRGGKYQKQLGVTLPRM